MVLGHSHCEGRKWFGNWEGCERGEQRGCLGFLRTPSLRHLTQHEQVDTHHRLVTIIAINTGDILALALFVKSCPSIVLVVGAVRTEASIMLSLILPIY